MCSTCSTVLDHVLDLLDCARPCARLCARLARLCSTMCSTCSTVLDHVLDPRFPTFHTQLRFRKKRSQLTCVSPSFFTFGECVIRSALISQIWKKCVYRYGFSDFRPIRTQSVIFSGLCSDGRDFGCNPVHRCATYPPQSRVPLLPTCFGCSLSFWC
jgi:hypothetical protein